MTIKERMVVEDVYSSPETLLKDVYFLNSLSKIEQYKAEVEFFEKKYGVRFAEFRKNIRKTKGREDFTIEEDMEDWEFAVNALEWWTKKAENYKNA